MSHQRRTTRLFVAAIATLLAGSLAGASGLVLCVGTNGHSAIELEHAGAECPNLAGGESNTGISRQAPADCLDLPAASNGTTTPSSFDPEWALAPPAAFRALHCELPPHLATRFADPADARAGFPHLALHLTTTILLV